MKRSTKARSLQLRKVRSLVVHMRRLLIEKILGKSFIIPILPIHRDPVYYPNPMRFDPERFSDENKGSIDPDTYMPFGKMMILKYFMHN